MLAMDVSRSMLATDVDPDRMTAARAAAETFVDQLPAGFRVGLVAFSTDARLVVAPTTDRAEVHTALENLQADGGTALGDAIMISLQATADARTTAARHHARRLPVAVRLAVAVRGAGCGPAAARGDRAPVRRRQLDRRHRAARRRVGCGRRRDARVHDRPRHAGRHGRRAGPQTGQVQTLNVPPDTDTLAAIAETTSGRYFAAPTSEDLAQIYESLGSKVGYTQQEQEVTQWFAAAALLLVLGGAGLAALWFNRIP